MNRSRSIALVLLAVPLLASCQQYELQTVEPKYLMPVPPVPVPVGMPKPAKLMLAVDTSGSMDSPVSASDEATKWTKLVEAFCGRGGFLDGTIDHRVGLATFPDGDECGGGTIKEPIPADKGLGVDAIKAHLSNLAPAGGTPIAATLRAIAADTGFSGEEQATRRFVVLLTDGLPNCDATEPTTCECSSANPIDCTGEPRNCLDEDDTLASVRALKDAGVETFVIGFGEGTAGEVAKRVLNSAAIAGGRARASDPYYYQANSAEELQQVLEQIRGQLQTCSFPLEHAPLSTSLILVTLQDDEEDSETTLVQGVDWSYEPEGNAILLLGSTCTRIQETPMGRLALRYSYLAAE